MDLAALEAGLDAEQLKAVTTTASPVAVLAPAGSGKTRVLSRRVAHRIAREEIEPQHVLAVTFTRRAASELRTRLSALGLRDRLTAGTFHALALGQIRDHRRDHRLPAPKVLDRKRSLLHDVTGQQDSRALAEIATEIEWAKARQVPPAHYVERAEQARRRTRAPRPVIAEAYRGYEVAKSDRGFLDFDDLLLEAARLIERDPEFARAQRWRFRHLFVDEFQDINPLQFRLLEAWRGDRYDLFLVGDPQQAIYTWNGSDPNFLIDIEQHYPPVQVIRLATNYRSTPQILAGASSVLASAGLMADVVAPIHADGELPALQIHEDEEAEARAIARAVRRSAGPGSRWSSQAVLVRTNAQLAALREAFRTARIPHELRGADPLVDDPAIRRILDDLDRDRRPLAAVISGLEALETDPGTQERLDQLVARAREFGSADHRTTGADLAAWLRTSSDRRSTSGTAVAVTLATFHAAKGLEWPVVHLAGLELGFVPIGHARTREARAEEARLLYVAMTRAERTLHLHAARRRHVGTRLVDRQVSPLLSRLPMSLPGVDREVAHRTIATTRAALARRPVDSDHDRVAVAVREWRELAARRARIAPDAVLSESVMRRVLEIRPHDVDGLASITGLGPIKAARFGDELLRILVDDGGGLRDPARP